jgi:hypothetical protein
MNIRLIKYVLIFFFTILFLSLLIQTVYTVKGHQDRDSSSTEMGIKEVRPYYDRNHLHLEIIFEKPYTCQQLMETLNIKSFQVKNKFYEPSCRIKGTRAVIAYVNVEKV